MRWLKLARVVVPILCLFLGAFMGGRMARNDLETSLGCMTLIVILCAVMTILEWQVGKHTNKQEVE